MSDVEESAKAAEEIAKAGSKAIDATREAGGWLDRIFGSAIEHMVGRFSDRMLARRIEASIYDWERLITQLHNVERKLQKRSIKITRVVPPKIALPLLQHATMEHEDDLHELWENLLVSALDPSGEEIKRTYVSVLSELSAQDAHALRRLYAEWLYWTKRGTTPEIRGEGEHRYSSGVAPGNDESAVLFFRLGLVRPVHLEVEYYQSERPVLPQRDKDPASASYYVVNGDKALVLSNLDVVALTEFGEKFCKAVIGDVSGLYERPVRR